MGQPQPADLYCVEVNGGVQSLSNDSTAHSTKSKVEAGIPKDIEWDNQRNERMDDQRPSAVNDLAGKKRKEKEDQPSPY